MSYILFYFNYSIIFIMTLYTIPSGKLVMYHVNERRTPESKVPLTPVTIIGGWAPAIQLTKTYSHSFQWSRMVVDLEWD